MSSISQKKNNFKVQIRRKRVEDKIAHLRTNYLQQNAHLFEEQFSDIKICKLMEQSLISKQKLIQNISLIKTASFYINQGNSKLFFPLVDNFCYILGNLQSMKQTQKLQNKDFIYNQILTVLINISSNEMYQWPVGQYLPIIKNLLNKSRQINTLWLLSNILYQKPNQNSDTAKQLTRELVKYDSISFCQQRFEKKFDNENDIRVFTLFACSFLTNSIFLSLEEHKKIIAVVEKLSSLNIEQIDLYILDSMNDHAPYLKKLNYELLYSELISKFRESYIKKKKTKIVLKYLEFVKTYIFCQIQQSLGQNGEQIDSKQMKANYQRISINTLPNLVICYENKSPSIRAMLMQICSILLQYYFAWIDLQSQQLYLSLAQGLKQDTCSVLSKYSNKALYWQLHLTMILFKKLREYKKSKQLISLISQFLVKNNIMQALNILLKDKSQDIQLVGEITQFLLLLLNQFQKESSYKKNNNQNEKYQFYLDSIKQTYEIVLNNHLIHDQLLHRKIQDVIHLCEKRKL